MMGDPDFVDKLVLVHRESAVSSKGQNILTERKCPTYGSIQPVDGKTLQRLPDDFRVANVMSFWLKGKIVSDGRDKYPDIIIHKNIRYQVQTVNDWSAWGEGWSEGTCVQEKPAR